MGKRRRRKQDEGEEEMEKEGIEGIEGKEEMEEEGGETKKRRIREGKSAAEVLEGVIEDNPGREKEIESMLRMIGTPLEHCGPLFVFGHSGTGKTRVMKGVMQYLRTLDAEWQAEMDEIGEDVETGKKKGKGKAWEKAELIQQGKRRSVSFVNCIQMYSMQLLMEQTLKQVLGMQRWKDLQSGCHDMTSFVDMIKMAIGETTLKTYLVFDHAEKLRELPDQVLSVLLRLDELTGCNVCVVLISRIVFEKFRIGTGVPDPMQVYFCKYSREVMMGILKKEHQVLFGGGDVEDGGSRSSSSSSSSSSFVNVNDDSVFVGRFVKMLLDLFYSVCSDVAELRYLMRLLYPVYSAPVKEGKFGKDQSKELFNEMLPFVHKATQKIFLREFSLTEWADFKETSGGTVVAKGGDGTRKTRRKNRSGKGLDFELPYYAKYLLLAAYLASYNPATMDKRFFGTGKVKAKTRLGGKGETVTQELLGPKTFPIERLIAIYHSILLGEDPESAELFHQIVTLESLGFLSRMSNSSNLDAIRIRCNVDRDFINGIAKNLKFDIEGYLYKY